MNATPALIASHLFALGFVLLVFSEMYRLNDVRNLLAFYGTFHQDPLNQWIHFFGVPGILWSLFLFFAHLPLLGQKVIKISGPGIPCHNVTYSSLLAAAYTVYYLYVDPIGGVLYFPVTYLKYVTVVRMVINDQRTSTKKFDMPRWYGTGRLLWIALFTQFLSWYLQIHLGHHFLEGSKPAILTSIGPTFTIAPLFAYYEGIWKLGINTGLQNQTLRLIAENTARLCRDGSTMRICKEAITTM